MTPHALLQDRRLRQFALALLCLTLLSACGEDDTGSDSDVAPDVSLEDAGSDTQELDTSIAEPRTDTDVADAEVPEDVTDAEAPDVVVEVPSTEGSDIMAKGPLGVGYVRTEFTYESDGFGERTLAVAVWYPTVDPSGMTARYAGLLFRPGVLENASVALTEPAPVAVFSHGNSSFAEQNAFQVEYLASHGWIVVAPEHTGNTWSEQVEDFYPYFDVRPQDITALIDGLDTLPNTEFLAGLMSDDIVMTGHSFGAYTTLAMAGATYDVDDLIELCSAPDATDPLCETALAGEVRFRAGFLHPRIKLAVPMNPAGDLAFDDGVANIEVPTLLMTSGMDATLPEVMEGDPIWSKMDGPDDRRLIIATAGHFTYTNFCEYIPGPAEDDGCSERFMDYEVAHQLVNAYFLAFARKHLDGDDSYDDLLSGSRSLHDDCVILAH